MNVSQISQELQHLQRQKSWLLKTRNMNANRLRAMVATDILGYRTSQDPADRQKAHSDADRLIKGVLSGTVEIAQEAFIRLSSMPTTCFDNEMKKIEKQMVKLAQQLPVAEWTLQPEQRGFGLASLAQIIGETGDLSNYLSPGKVWKRLGCAPFEQDGVTRMGREWAVRAGKKDGLRTENWVKFGYSPRRRSIAYVIGENLVKQNQAGPYRSRYDITKAARQEKHPDNPKIQCHRHGMLLATKLLLKNLWSEWNQDEVFFDPEHEEQFASV